MLLSGRSVCVHPQAIINAFYMNNQSNNPTAFQFLCNALAIDTIDGWGLSNKARRE